jgi:hypothetical protein
MRLARFGWIALASALAIEPCLAGQKLGGGGLSLARNALNSGGSLLASAGLRLNNGLSENSIALFSGGGYRLSPGLMHLAAQPGSVTSIAGVSKSTGTLELAWTAPGLDGFQGAVDAGLYRIDYSSDSSHAFDPSVYRIEFPTATVPGSEESYTLSGLSPNTTYFVRIYLADRRKVVAETSAQRNDSTLSNLPAAPFVSGVFRTSATISWSLPAGGAEGYSMEASSTNFGAKAPGGVTRSTSTRDGGALSLNVSGLRSATTYYFRLGSLNWSGDLNVVTLLGVCTLPAGLDPVQGLSAQADPDHRSIVLTWSNPVDDRLSGVLVLMSTAPIPDQPLDGEDYFARASMPGGVARSSSVATMHLETGVPLDTTQYFRIFTQTSELDYSVSVDTQIVLDLPPFLPAGISAVRGPLPSQVTVSWNPVTSNSDGSAFRSAGSDGWELTGYRIYRSTSPLRSGWTLAGTVWASSSSFTADLPDPDLSYFFKIAAVDGLSGESPEAMVLAEDGDVYAVSPDRMSCLRIPASLAGSLRTPEGPLVLRARERAEDLNSKIVKSVEFGVFRSPDNAPQAGFRLPDSSADVVLRYETSGGVVVPSTGPLLAGAAANLYAESVPASEADRKLGAYWHNGREFVKLYGRVDPADQTVRVKTAMAGTYQIRSVLRNSGFNFDISNMSNKAITPNGDGLNDTVVFVFDNPKDSGYEGKIFDVRGAFVADLRPGPVADSLLWDGKSGGRVVSGGVYIYQIRAEGRVFNGTVVVIR